MKKVFIFLTVLIFIGFAVYLSTFTVDENEKAVVTRFGNPVQTIEKAGLYIKRPGFLEKVNYFDKRTKIFETEPVQLLLKDKNPVITRVYIAWKIKDPLKYFETVGLSKKNSESKLGDIVNSQLGIVFGDYKIGNIINTQKDSVKLEEIEKKILKNSNEKAIKKYGVEIVQTGIQRVAYPSVVTNAVYERMKSERNKEAEKLKAEGKEAADIIRSAAKKEASEIVSVAEKEAMIIKGEGEKEAMSIYTQAFSKDTEFFDLLTSLEMYKKVMNENTTLILSTDSELFKYLDLKDKGGR